MEGFDWRVSVYLNVSGGAPLLVRAKLAARALKTEQFRQELQRRVTRGAIRLRTGHDLVFLYAREREVALAARQAALDLLAEHDMPAQVLAEHWNAVPSVWEPVDAPMTAEQAAALAQAEQLAMDAAETRESLVLGAAMYSVRVELSSHREVVALAARLEAEGNVVVRRRRFLVVGANNAHQAERFAAAIRQQVPDGAEVSVENHINPQPGRSGWLAAATAA